jgi:hypothetical protein
LRFLAVAASARNQGSPEALPLRALGGRFKAVNLKDDPWKKCEPVGPFRMMAREGTKIEIVPAKDMIVMLFEDLSHGLMRTIHMNRTHPPKLEDKDARWMGDSTGHWEGDTLVIDTTGFNDRTWLNDQGAQHSSAMHLVERIRPVPGGRYLEYKMTIEDAAILARPYTYTRTLEKLTSEIGDDVCEDQP